MPPGPAFTFGLLVGVVGFEPTASCTPYKRPSGSPCRLAAVKSGRWASALARTHRSLRLTSQSFHR